MKVFLRYEDNDDSSLHKTLKMTLPKSWKAGPTSRLLEQFVESYNSSSLGDKNALNPTQVHFALRKEEGDDHSLTELASDDVLADSIEDRADVYVMHGPSQTREEMDAARAEEEERIRKERESTVACTHFGCKNRFPRGGPYPECSYHVSPPIFHETAKYWSCCPNKKAYDWDEFQEIPGCQKGVCSEVKEEGQKDFLGGCDVREQLTGGGGPKLRSIDDFNREEAGAGGGVDDASGPVLERLRSIMGEVGVDNELFDQVVDGLRREVTAESSSGGDGQQSDDAVAAALGAKLKDAMKAIAVGQLRIS